MQGLDWEKEEESVEKYYFEEEWKEAVLLTKENKPTVLVLYGEELEICCPKTVRGNVSECGTPCLVLESKYSKNGNYETMAFSLDTHTGRIRTGSALAQLLLKMQLGISLPTTTWKDWLVNVWLAGK